MRGGILILLLLMIDGSCCCIWLLNFVGGYDILGFRWRVRWKDYLFFFIIDLSGLIDMMMWNV